MKGQANAAQQRISNEELFKSPMFRATYQQMFGRRNQLASKVKRILLIEDDIDMSEVLQLRLKKMYNCNVDVAADPFEAMNKMVEGYYDLIILDWNLPVLNGEETLLRADQAMAYEPSLPIEWDKNEVPVVVFSSSDKEDCKVRKTKHFNYVGHISKAQPLNKILTTIAEFIQRKTAGFRSI
ncbi:MAG: response regulator [Bdellovibrionaceae bacterium]|nr:response regulator [Pseudobdellovibrionaceae bacterium]